MADSVIRARLDPTVKKKATRALKRMGLTTSGVLRLLMVRIAEEEKLPFEPLAPNKKTISAMKEARRGGLKSYRNADEMLAALNGKKG